nr:DUF1441 family protein [Spartinivicinus marinus]
MCRKTVSKRLEMANVQPVGKRRGYDVYASDVVGPVLFNAASNSNSLKPIEQMTPRERNEWYRSENEKLTLLEREKKLVPVEDVRRELHQVVSTVNQQLETLPDQLERNCQLSSEALSQVQVVTDGIRQSLYDRIK